MTYQFVQIGFPAPPISMGLEPNAKRFLMRDKNARLDPGCTIIVGHSARGFHLSISRPDRDPTWQEIRDARYKLIPNNVTMAMLLPPQEEYVNVHPHCFHLWQVQGDFSE